MLLLRMHLFLLRMQLHLRRHSMLLMLVMRMENRRCQCEVDMAERIDARGAEVVMRQIRHERGGRDAEG